MPKDSILILTSSFPRWRNDTDPPFVFHLAQRLSAYFDITVLAPHCGGARRQEAMGKLRVVRFKYFLKKHQNLAYQGGILSNLRKNPLLNLQIPFFLFFELLSLIRTVRQIKPSVLHAHWIIPQGIIAVIACCFVRVKPKLVCTAHGADVYGLKDPLSKHIRRFVIRNFDSVAAVSKAMKNDIERETDGLSSLKIIPMGVDLTTCFTSVESIRNRHQLLFVGRMVAKKGLLYLLEAMLQIRQHIPDASLLVIGDGYDRKRFQAYTVETGSDQYITFLGAIPNHELATYYRGAEILVFPSIVADDGDREGLGLVPIEAMGCGCGVIATDLEAVQDVVQHAINGFIVPQRSAKAIAETVVYLFQNRSVLEKIQQRGRRSVYDKFDWDRVAEKYRGVYQGLITQPKS